MKFVNITENDFLSEKLLYKYAPLENALKTLENRSLWFANPTTWKDPFEKRFIEAKYSYKGTEKYMKWKNRIFCMCLTQTMVSEASWKVYSPNDIGVQLRIYREKLLDVLQDVEDKYFVYIGKAEYMKTDDILQDLSNIPLTPPETPSPQSDKFAARLLMLKRMAFQYENEIRIILVDKDTKKAGYRKGIEVKYNCDNTELIQRIVLDPEIGNMTYNLIKERLEGKYGFVPKMDIGDTFNRVIKSSIYKDNKSELIKF